MNSSPRVLICSSAVALPKNGSQTISSSVVDNVADGYRPGTSPDGVLMTFRNVPLAYYDVPTLNRMVYSRRLWDSLFQSPAILNAISSNSFWMDSCHRDEDEVFLENVAGRVTRWDYGDNNTIVGDIDVMDTPKGAIISTLCRTGRVGTSTRGFGSLDDIGNGLTEVNVDNYIHVSSDFVSTPAVPHSTVSVLSQFTDEYVNQFKQEMIGLLQETIARNPATTLQDFLSVYSGRDAELAGGVVAETLGSTKVPHPAPAPSSWRDSVRDKYRSR